MMAGQTSRTLLSPLANSVLKHHVHLSQRKQGLCTHCTRKSFGNGILPMTDLTTVRLLRSVNACIANLHAARSGYSIDTPLSQRQLISPVRFYSAAATSDEVIIEKFSSPEPDFNWEFLCNPINSNLIRENIISRKGVGDIDKLLVLWQKSQTLRNTGEFDDFIQPKSSISMVIPDFLRKEEDDLPKLRQELLNAAAEIPNMTHPQTPLGDESQSQVLETIGEKREFAFQPKSVMELGEQLDALRTSNVGITTGEKTYYLKGPLAVLEQALIKYTVDTLTKEGFRMISVPDLIHPSIIEGCGFRTTGERTQIYRLDPRRYGDVCLAGTGEMSLAGYFRNKQLHLDKLPERVLTVSRCFRAETSSLEHERGLYRVHQFYKVEMFGVTAADSGRESEALMEEFVNIQKKLYTDLGLHCRVMDMASQELGAPAYRKLDIETFMPAKNFWGEISSTSNCTDFQSRRLNITYWDPDSQLRHCHTVNGTACAVPRMIMAVVEHGQQEDGSVVIPDPLRPYMDGSDVIRKPSRPLVMQPIVITKTFKKRVK